MSDDAAAWLCEWLSTQAVVDGHGDDDVQKPNGFGCIVLRIKTDRQCYELHEGDNTIGRNPLNSICIEHPSVSMYHAVIQCDSDGVVLLDKGSLNKTKLNKKNLKKDVAYFLDKNALLMFGEVQANYYADGEPSQTVNVYNSTTEQKILGNNASSSSILPNKVSTSNFYDDEITKYASLDNGNNFTCTMETIVPKTAESGHGKNDMHAELNSSDGLLLEVASQIEMLENNIPNVVAHTSFREDTPSPVMDFSELFSSRSNDKTTHSSNNCTTTEKYHETVSVSDLNGLSYKAEPELMRENTPSPVMDLGPFCYSESRLTISDTKCSQYLVNKCTNKDDEFEETQMLEVNNSTHNWSTENIFDGNNEIIPKSCTKTSVINQSNTYKNNSLDECTQLPVWDSENVFDDPVTKKVDSLVLVNVNDKSVENKKKCDTPSMKICHGQSNNAKFINCSSITPSKLPTTEALIQLGVKTSSVLCKSETKSCKLNDLEIQVTNFNDDSLCKTTTLKKFTSNSSVSKHEKQNKTTFEADNDDILFKVDQEVESGEQPINIIETDNSFIKQNSKSQVCNKTTLKDVTKIQETKSQIPDKDLFHRHTNVGKITTSTSSVYEDSNQVPVMDDFDFFNCPTQNISLLKKMHLKDNVTYTRHEERTEQLSNIAHKMKDDDFFLTVLLKKNLFQKNIL